MPVVISSPLTKPHLRCFRCLNHFVRSIVFMSEMREELRKRVFKSGRIEFGLGAIDCIIRNISETGAALEVESPIGIPESFELVIVADQSRKPARVVWRKEKRLGVRFG